MTKTRKRTAPIPLRRANPPTADVTDAPPIAKPHANGAAETELQKRAQGCFEELRALLEKHRCVIVPHFEAPTPVGTNGQTIQLTATWSLAALP
jgi:hypothetical protein